MIDAKQPRLSVDLREDQKIALAQLIPWGIGRRVWHEIIDDMIELGGEFGPVFFELIASGRVKPREIMPSINLAQENARKVSGKDGND